MQITVEGLLPIPVERGDTILASLLRAGVAFAFSCQVWEDTTIRRIDAQDPIVPE